MCTPQAGRVAMAVSTVGLSEAIRPAFSKTWQNNLDGIGTLGVAPAMDAMNKQNSSSSPYTIKPISSSVEDPNPSATAAIARVNAQRANNLSINSSQSTSTGLNTSYV